MRFCTVKKRKNKPNKEAAEALINTRFPKAQLPSKLNSDENFQIQKATADKGYFVYTKDCDFNKYPMEPA